MPIDKSNGTLWALGAAGALAIAGAVASRRGGANVTMKQKRLTRSGWVARWDPTRRPINSVYLDYEGKEFKRSQTVIRYDSGHLGWEWPEIVPASVKSKVWELLDRLHEQSSRPQGSMGTRYEAQQWVEFFCGGNESSEAMRLGKRFEGMAWDRFMAWTETDAGQEFEDGLPGGAWDRFFNKHDVAYRTYASFAGHGIGLWDGELFFETGLVGRDESYALGEALEAWMEQDQALRDLGQELDEEISDCSWRAEHGQQQ